ncbi:hypothetical protein PHET_02626 [Paragonimus heterotremus]|uniref:RUN domain-containing protein n=1 Tax=Paragonimus heterotremus TaxID=100268 RepID=A0A8J4TPD9_9TREM|nr:hypothetical protein PHET_02626 [Paragonimus heterotremus]
MCQKDELSNLLRINVKTLLQEYANEPFRYVHDDAVTAVICSVLEACFLHRLVLKTTFLFSVQSRAHSSSQPCFWPLIKSLVPKHLANALANTGGKRTSCGRCRVWVRHSLNEATLYSYLSVIKSDASKLSEFYLIDAVLRDADFVNELMKLIELLEELRFRLDLTSPLLNTWNSSDAPRLLGWPLDRERPIPISLLTEKPCALESVERLEQAVLSRLSHMTPSLSLADDVGAEIVSDSVDVTKMTWVWDRTLADNDVGSRIQQNNVDLCKSSAEFNVQHLGMPTPQSSRPKVSKVQPYRRYKKPITLRFGNACPFPIGSNNIVNQFRSTWFASYSDVENCANKAEAESSDETTPNIAQNQFPAESHSFDQTDNFEGEGSWQVVGEDLLVILTEQDVARLVELFPGASSFDLADGQNCVFHGQCVRCERYLLPGSAFLDHYDARFYCSNCHQLQEAIIPRDVIFNWDFSVQPVSQTTKSFLLNLHHKPVINLARLNPTLYAVIPDLLTVRQLRRALVLLWHQIARCSAKAASDLRRSMQPLDYMLFTLNTLDVYSIQDLCLVQSGHLEWKLTSAIVNVALVHVHGCTTCRRRALLCDLCEDLHKPIWPHEFTSYQWMIVRACSHAGLWYSDNASVLSSQLASWLDNVNEDFKPARAIIVPHAGYRHSGSCAAYAYKQMDPQTTRRIFILGPSHHANIGSKCALSPANVCRTPLADLKIDEAIYKELQKTGEFVTFTKAQDEAEHSIEMQLPYIAQIAGNRISIVPIVVGGLSPERESVYGRLLAPFLRDPATVFVISSDFCHWGSRFGYQYYLENDGEIWQSIEKLDRLGMNAIETLKPTEFTSYLEQYRNTICGRRAISILLNAIQTIRDAQSGFRCQLRFLQYAQSSSCQTLDDSSVSYAAASLVFR